MFLKRKAIQVNTVTRSSTSLQCGLSLHQARHHSHRIINCNSGFPDVRIQKQVSLPCDTNVHSFLQCFLSASGEGTKYIIETPSQLVFHRHMRPPQQRRPLRSPGGPFPLRSNCHDENCHFSRIASTLGGCWESPEMLTSRRCQIFSQTVRCSRQILRSTFRLAHAMHLGTSQTQKLVALDRLNSKQLFQLCSAESF